MLLNLSHIDQGKIQNFLHMVMPISNLILFFVGNMDGNLVNTPTSQSIVMDTSGINSVSTVAPSPVILLPSNLMSPMILPTQQPDILQQALEAAMPNSSNASSGTVTKLPTMPIQPGAKTKEDFVTVFNSRDGTLRLTQENARALGINISTNEGMNHHIILELYIFFL